VTKNNDIINENAHVIPERMALRLDDQVVILIQKILENNECRLWDLKVTGRSFYFVLDKEDGLSTDMLSAIHKELYRSLEAALPIDSLGAIECVTPGIIRELKEEKHYVWSNGYMIDLTTTKDEEEITQTGVLTTEDGKFFLDGTEFNLREVKKALTTFDLKDELAKGKQREKALKKQKNADNKKK
jgi:ribosome maturation factor RimP